MTFRLVAALVVALSLPATAGTSASPRPSLDPRSYWTLPVPAQGPPPGGHHVLTHGLQPADCAACHRNQYVDWLGSRHARAYSAGVEIQEADMTPEMVRSCQSCHAPLAEQQRFGADGKPNPEMQRLLQRQGVSCAACHVRANKRFGPQPRKGLDPGILWKEKTRPHGPAGLSRYFEDSHYCATCHQFGPGAARPGGKPLENTYEEWRASPQAAKGETCQSCHMPRRRHLFLGIHDPPTVAKAIKLQLSDQAATLRNTGVGHMFPTYVTPRVVLRVDGLDVGGKVLVRREHTIQRVVDLEARPQREISDTRLAPGQAVSVPVPRATGIVQVRAEVLVWPDDYYERMFAGIPSAARAHQLAAGSHYTAIRVMRTVR